MAWEMRPRGADKGSAVAAVMALPAFGNRLPVFIGDDVTDEDGMRVARATGGAGLFVPRVFGSPGAVRDWLDRCRGGWGDDAREPGSLDDEVVHRNASPRGLRRPHGRRLMAWM